MKLLELLSKRSFIKRTLLVIGCAGLGAFAIAQAPAASAAEKAKIVMIAGRASHGRKTHAHKAGILLLARCLNEVSGVEAVPHLGGWVKEPGDFDGAATVVMYMDGRGGHEILKDDRLKLIGKLMDRGVGLCLLHYAVDVPKDRGGPEFLDWIGGYYEAGFSVNPHWTAEFKSLPKHPITRGLKPFTLRDEWYYHMRFRPEMEGVTPILKALPPDGTRRTAAAKANAGNEEIVAWAAERKDGGRGFGFTGGHFHDTWGNDSFRTLVLNAVVWTAKLEIPEGGVKSAVAPEELDKNLD